MPASSPRSARAISLAVVVVAAIAVAVPLLDAQTAATALTGATLIDGNGGPPIADAVVIVADGRIQSAGPGASVTVPAGARVIDASGKFIVPGLIDTNVHLSLYGGVQERYETLAKLMGAAQEAGLTRIGFVTEPPTEETPATAAPAAK